MEESDKKSILDLSLKEFQQFIKNKDQRDFAKYNLSLGIKELKFETQRIENTFDRLQQQEIGSMTIVGLLSFFVFVIVPNYELAKFFLIFVFPYLLLSLVIFVYFSSSRANIHRTSIAVGKKNTTSELLILRVEAIATQDIFRLLHDKYTKTLFWHNTHNLFVRIFILNFVLFSYIIFFHGIPNFCHTVLISLIVILTNLLILFLQKRKSKTISYDIGLKQY